MIYRRIARELVEKWSRPIFDQYREQDADEIKRQREDEFAKARKRRQIKEASQAPLAATGKTMHVYCCWAIHA